MDLSPYLGSIRRTGCRSHGYPQENATLRGDRPGSNCHRLGPSSVVCVTETRFATRTAGFSDTYHQVAFVTDLPCQEETVTISRMYVSPKLGSSWRRISEVTVTDRGFSTYATKGYVNLLQSFITFTLFLITFFWLLRSQPVSGPAVPVGNQSSP